MKNSIGILFASALILMGCSTGKITKTDNTVFSTIDLVNVKDDKVQVTINPGSFTNEIVNFHIPQTIPGTYQNSNFGKFIEDFKAYDYNGKEMEYVKNGDNTWKIENGKQLDKISYWVNDTFDAENAEGIYPMEGTSHKAGDVFYLNLHGYIGYFNDQKETPYNLEINSPANLKPYTTLPTVSQSDSKDVFRASRYFYITDNPIMYVGTDAININLGNIQVELAVYSPSGKHKATQYKETVTKMMKAQKAFMGNVNNTKEYGILLYLATPEEVKTFGGVLGALEHHTSTTVVFSDDSDPESLKESITDVVAHEFFHTLTPLNVHSEEIHYFDYNEPKLSQHLWMYEGNTEYFANLFQVNQGLISEDDFYKRMAQKISISQQYYNDTMSFTKMSLNAADKPYSDQYGNVYQKGALINMCIDILMREQSNGEKGVLWMMSQLSDKYGVERPFKDDQLFNDIKALGFPKVDAFLQKYVVEGAAIPYEEYFAKVGVGSTTTETNVPSIFMGSPNAPFFSPNPEKGVVVASQLNTSLKALGMKKGDIILGINDIDLTKVFTDPTIGSKINDLFQSSGNWDENTDISFKVKRGEKEMTLKGKVGKPSAKSEKFGADKNASNQQKELRNAWLKG